MLFIEKSEICVLSPENLFHENHNENYAISVNYVI